MKTSSLQIWVTTEAISAARTIIAKRLLAGRNCSMMDVIEQAVLELADREGAHLA